jgi:hypothetical protein
MKKLYKVYAKCVRRAAGYRILEADDSDLREAIQANIDNVFECGSVDADLDDEEAVNKFIEELYEKFDKSFQDTGIISCGDYMLIESEYDEITIPNRIGWEII